MMDAVESVVLSPLLPQPAATRATAATVTISARNLFKSGSSKGN